MRTLTYKKSGLAEVEDQDRMPVTVIESITQDYLERVFNGWRGEITAVKCDELARDLREELKALKLTRYKLVVQVAMGEAKGQGVRLASRCLWDPATDNVATAVYRTDDFYCVAAVFGLFVE